MITQRITSEKYVVKDRRRDHTFKTVIRFMVHTLVSEWAVQGSHVDCKVDVHRKCISKLLARLLASHVYLFLSLSYSLALLPFHSRRNPRIG